MLLPRLLGFVALALPSLALVDQSFENTAIVRTIDLLGSIVHVTTTYAVKALESGSTYTFALSEEDAERTSFIEAKVKGGKDALPLEKHLYNPGSGVALYSIELPSSLKAGSSINLVVDTAQTHAIYPWPKEASQGDEQALKYDTDVFVLSPYKTTVQRTKIRAPSPKIISYTTPEAVDTFTTDAVATKSGATVTYGPFSNFGSSASSEFLGEHQKRVSVRYHHEYPVLEVRTLKRSAEISHWGANLNIQDEIDLFNAGPKLKGHFSRLEHQTHMFYQHSMPTVLKQIALQLPPGIHDAYYVDIVGNVSTSKLRTVPSVPKGQRAASHNQHSILELKPRYPLLGGWNYSFTIGWDSPLGDSASYDSKEGRWIVAVPLMTQIPAAVVDSAEVKVILPEGATDIEVFPPFPPKMMSRSTHTTYLDTVGRPAVSFEYEQLTDKHMGTIYVSYKVSTSSHLKKPFAVATALMSLFAFAIAARRVDLSIEKVKK